MQQCGDVELLLSSDDALLKACHVVMAAAKIPLSQQLLSLQQTMDSLGDEVGVVKMGKAEGGVTGEEVDVEEVGRIEGVKVGVAIKEEVKRDSEQVGVEISLMEGKAVEVGVPKGSGVEVNIEEVTAPTDVRGSRMDGLEPSEQVFSGAAFQQEGLNEQSQVEDPPSELQVGGPAVAESGTAQIPVNVDFPCGPPLHSALEGEPDLDETLLHVDEEELASSNSNFTLMDSDPTILNPEPVLPSFDATLDSAISDVSGSLPQELDAKSGMDGNAEVDVARSHSKVIPLPPNHCPPTNGTRTPDSTPSSSMGGSVGQVSLNREVSVDSTVSGSTDISKTTGHVQLTRRRSWQSESKGRAMDDDDVVAVPMIVRSTSTG